MGHFGASAPYDRLGIGPGEDLSLGSDGGVLLVTPPPPGAMSRTDMENRIWSLLREPGPDQGYPAPQSGDFPQAMVDRDLNIALGNFISETGLAPAISDHMRAFPVFAVLDYPLPPSLVSLARAEYTPAGLPTYVLQGLSFEDFDSMTGGMIMPTFGQPYFYRKPFDGYIRLQPQPSLGNQNGYGVGTMTFTGSPTVGDSITVKLVNGVVSVIVPPYYVSPTDNLGTIANNVANLINNSAAVTGPNQFLQPAETSQNQITLAAIQSPGTSITYQVLTDSTTMIVEPNNATNLAPNGDTITFYYSSLGSVLVAPGDTPGIPAQFQMALVYRCLMDYWAVKQDFNQAKLYEQRYNVFVMRAKAFVFDSDRATQPTIAGDDSEFVFPGAGLVFG